MCYYDTHLALYETRVSGNPPARRRALTAVTTVGWRPLAFSVRGYAWRRGENGGVIQPIDPHPCRARLAHDTH